MTFAGIVAFLSLGLLVHIERSAYVQHKYQRTLLIRLELERLIKYATIPSESTIHDFIEKSKSAESVAEQEAYYQLAKIAEALAKRDTTLCNNAVSKVLRETEEQAEAIAKADKIAKAKAARIELQEKLRSKLGVARTNLPVEKTIELANKGIEYLFEPSIAIQKWRILFEFGEKLQESGQTNNIPELLQAIAGVQSVSDVHFEIVLEGTERDGYYNVFSMHQGVTKSFADGLFFETSIDGLMAAFFISAALPSRLAWGHGLYGRDQRFIFDQDRMVTILENDKVSSDNDGLLSVTPPSGLRFSRGEDGTLTMCCIAYLPGNGFYDYSVSIANGIVTQVQESKLFQWGQGVYY